MNNRLIFARTVTGAAALVFWVFIFSCGLLIDSTGYRRHLSPGLFADEPQAAVGAVIAPAFSGSSAVAFLAATFCFTPTNLVLLTLLAGLLGGCASNVAAERSSDELPSNLDTRKRMYLEESPWSAMMRSFVVYLLVIAGLYFVVDDPFKNPTPSQYMRLAGTVSVLAFVVGFDPTRFERLISSIPDADRSQTLTLRGGKNGVEVTAAQGPIAENIAAASVLENGGNERQRSPKNPR